MYEMPRDYRLLGGGSAGDEIGSSNSSSSMPRNNGMGDAEAPLAQETASDSAKPRVVLVHPTSTGLALNVEAVAAVGLHWKDTREAAELAAAPTGPQCSPTEAYSWLLRAWTVFLICWTPAIIMIGAFSHIRMSTEEEGSLADWRSFLWGGCAGLSCFQWGVFVAVVIVLVLVFFLGATAPLSMPALLVFSPLEDVNLALLLADKGFALEAAILFELVLLSFVAWAWWNRRCCTNTGKAGPGGSWAVVAALGCVVATLGVLAAALVDCVSSAECGLDDIQFARHGIALLCAIGLTLLVVIQTRSLAEECSASEHWLPGLFIFLPPTALSSKAARRVN